MIALLVMTDGREEYLDRCRFPLWGEFAERWMHDDSGDDAYRRELAKRYPHFRHIGRGPRRGFGGAIGHAWTYLSAASSARFVFHLEDDFTPTRHVDLADMANVLDANPHLVQMALRRQAWNAAEQRVGGVVEQHPDDYAEVTDGVHTWLEHRRFFTTNPSLYRRSLCQRPWPVGLESEGRFGLQLFAEDPALRGAFWGARDSGEWVTHIGYERVGTGY